MAAAAEPTPVTVFTGFLGSGKTTVILGCLFARALCIINTVLSLSSAVRLIRQLPADSRVALLKNEYGDVNVDGLLAQQSGIAVQEMMNGCLCCVLVGQMENGLRELRGPYQTPRCPFRPSRVL